MLEHGVKVTERVFETRIMEKVVVDDIQFGFRPGTATTRSVFVARLMLEKHGNKGKKLLRFCTS